MDGLLQDLRYAFRTLRKSPGFSALALLTISLGTGASTAVFSMVNGVLLRSLPYPNGDRIVRIEQPLLKNHDVDAGFSVIEVQDLQAGAPALDEVVEYHSMPFQLYGRGEPERVQTGVVSDQFFAMMGVRPILGRLFARGEDAVGAPPVVLLSYRYWHDHLGGDPTVIGGSFTMNDKIHHIVGVLPPLPGYPDENDIWMPAGACPFRSAPNMMNQRDMRMVRAFGRIRPDASFAQAKRDVAALIGRLRAQYPSAYSATNPLDIRTTLLYTELTSQARPILLTLLAAAAFLLIIAAANFANLTIARQLRRSREFTVRGALGAGSGRLVRQLVVESLAITLPSAVLGTAIAYAGLGMLRTLALNVTPRAAEITIDPRVLAFALASSFVVGVAAGLAPLARLRKSLQDTVRRGDVGGSAGPGEGRLRNILVAAQLATSFVVLVAAGLMTRSLLRLQKVDDVVDAASIATARVDLNWSRYTTNEQVRAFADQLLQRIAAAPGMVQAAVATDFPLNSSRPFRTTFLVSRTAGVEPPPVRADISGVGPAYFSVLGIPILAGRAFTTADRDTVAPPAVVGERFARIHWPGMSALGQRLSPDSGRHWSTVVGVAADVHQNNLTDEITDFVYLPYNALPSSAIRVLMRTRGPADWTESRLRAGVRELDERQPVDAFRTVRDVRDARLTQPRLTTVLLVSFAMLALLITAAGVNGVIANSVGQRLREIAIRQALGAGGRRIMAGLLVPLALTLAVGLGFGALVAVPLSRLMSGLLFEVQPTDVVTYGVVGLGLATVAFLAAFVPARTALKVDPARALRGE